MNFKSVLTTLAISLASPALAQHAGAPASTAKEQSVALGTEIYASDGVKIGTVAGVEGNAVLLEFDGRAIAISTDAIATQGGRATVNITKAELLIQFDQQVAKFVAQ